MQESIISQYLFLGKNYRTLGINKIPRKKKVKKTWMVFISKKLEKCGGIQKHVTCQAIGP